MAHTLLLRKLLHDISNIMAGIQGSLESIELNDITPGPARERYQKALQYCYRIKEVLQKSQKDLYITYRRHYSTYKGEPMLKDKNGTEIHLKDLVEVPNAEPDDLWEHSFVGIVISTIRGDGIITVRDTADDCWDVEANRVEKLQ